MEQLKTDGVVLARTFVGEKDAIIKILTPRAGLISASAKGVKNIKSKLSAGCSLFSFSEFLLKEDHGRYIVASTSQKEGFYGLSSNIERLSFAAYIAELVQSFSPSGEDAAAILPLLLNTFYLLSNTNKDMSLIKCVFELRFLCHLGFFPELDACNTCGETDALCFFSPSKGGTLCKSCAGTDDACLITKSTLLAMRYAQTADDKKAFSFSLPSADINEFERCTETMLDGILSRRLPSLTYLKQITGKI